VKIRISILWVFFSVAMSAHYALYLYEPGVLQKVINEEMALSPELALVETFTNWLIPLTMAFLTVTLADAKNRILNLILGGVFTLLGIIHLGICPIVHISESPSIHQLLISIATIVVTAPITWNAYKWSE
jgi:hypothetical protein